ncbi:MAG TPA: hypothetical protein VF740_14620 [Candidatus Acidoferrum sp.]
MGYAPGMEQSPPAVLVRGSGIAASCCLRLLQEAHIVAADPGSRLKLPALLISQGTQNLLADVFQTTDLFYGLPAIRKRVVAWGGKEVVVLPHSGVVVPENEIIERLRARIVGLSKDSVTENPAWTIYSTRPTNPGTIVMNFGTRMAVVNEAELVERSDSDACWVEAVERGWLFLLPTGEGLGSLIAVGGPAEQLLENSRLVGPQVRKLGKRVVEFAAYPRILSRLCGDGWLACGTAAMSFDPLCGEGAGNAAREAILACAAVEAIFRGEPGKEVLAEYSLRLTLGFLRHLEKCREFYAGPVGKEFWSSELELIEKGVAWTKSQLAGAPNSRFRLVGFALERAIRDKTG